jgi:hypothetical protein
MSNEKEMSAVEWFNDEIFIHLNFDQRLYLKDIYNQAKEMQKKQSQQYAEFCVRCDRENLPLLDFESYILTYGSNK